MNRRGFLGAAAALVAAPAVPFAATAAPAQQGPRVWRTEIGPMTLKRGERWYNEEQAYLLPPSDAGWSEEWEIEPADIPADIWVGIYGPGDEAWVEVTLLNEHEDLVEVPRFALIVREESK